MPAPNPLTPEEEEEFAQHGVASSGQGGEPIADENQQDDGQQQQDDQQQQQGEEQQPPSRHREDGTFKTKEEFEAEMAEFQQKQGTQQKPEGQQQQEEPKTVPLAALHAERQRAAEAVRRASLAETRMNAMLLAQQQRGERRGASAMPKLDEDPAGYIQALEARLEKFEQAREEENQFRQIDTALEQDEELFAMTTPDYHQASDYYVKSRAKELLQFYPPDEAQRIMVQEARSIANEAWQRGTSAGQVIYTLAQARGYVSGQGQQNQQDQGQQGQQGRQGQQKQQSQRSNAQSTIRDIRHAQSQSKSLGGGGGAGTKELNAEALLAMNDEEFEEYLGLGQKGANARFAAIG